MIPDEINGDASRQELIDLLSRMTRSENDEPTEISIVRNGPAVEDGEIINLTSDNDDNDDDETSNVNDVEDGELSESDVDDVDVLNLRLSALQSLADVKERQEIKRSTRLSRHGKQSTSHSGGKSKRKRYANDDTDLRSSIKSRSSSSRYRKPSNNHDDRQYLLDKDYRQPGVFDMLLSLMTPDANSSTSNRKLHDNYDIQHMDIVDDHMLPPPPLPLNHVPLFDPLPPLPPPPPSLFNMFPFHSNFPAPDWPRPNFVTQMHMPMAHADHWQPNTDVDLRLPSFNNHHQSYPVPIITEPILQRKSHQRRKRSKKVSKKQHQEREQPVLSNDALDKVQEPPAPLQISDDEEESRLRDELLRTMSRKRKEKPVEPGRTVTIVPSPPAPPTVTKSQYSINQRYKRVKANVPPPVKPEPVVARPTVSQPIIQTRNKLVRMVRALSR